VRIAVAARDPADISRTAGHLAVVDRACTMPGRGAYLCRDDDDRRNTLVNGACLERAIQRGGVARTLRTRVTLQREIVESEIR